MITRDQQGVRIATREPAAAIRIQHHQYVTAGGGRHGTWRIDQGGADRSVTSTSAATQRTGGRHRPVMAADRLAVPGAMAAELADR